MNKIIPKKLDIKKQLEEVNEPLEGHLCERCGQTYNTKWSIEPFNHEINEVEIKMWLCDNCYEDSLLSI